MSPRALEAAFRPSRVNVTATWDTNTTLASQTLRSWVFPLVRGEDIEGPPPIIHQFPVHPHEMNKQIGVGFDPANRTGQVPAGATLIDQTVTVTLIQIYAC